MTKDFLHKFNKACYLVKISLSGLRDFNLFQSHTVDLLKILSVAKDLSIKELSLNPLF